MHKPNIYQANRCPPCPPSATPWEKCVYWLGIGLGTGLPRRAAGTWGTVGGALVALPLLCLGFWGFLIVTIIGSLVGSYVCGKTSCLMGVHDDPHIVFDEWVGMWLSLLPSVYFLQYTPAHTDNQAISLVLWFVVPFVLFRFFDIAKPFPIKWVDKTVSGGFGILIDDVLAGVMSAICAYWLFVVWAN